MTFGHSKLYILLPKLTCIYADLHDYKTICSPDGQQLLVGMGANSHLNLFHKSTGTIGHKKRQKREKNS